MTLSEFLKYVETKRPLKGDEIHQFMSKMNDEARHMTFELNGSYHDLGEICGLLSRLLNKSVDPPSHTFPLFYANLGEDIMVDKNVFINACYHFQDHGGVVLGDGCQTRHNVVFATLNYGFAPEDRNITYPALIVLKKDIWVGPNATILSGVTIGENAIAGVGSVVTRDVPDNTIMGDVPAKVIKYIR